jgi:hypothetical protein
VIQRWLESLLPTNTNQFADWTFKDLFYPITIAAAVFLIGSIVFYNIQVRRYHRHPPLLALQEWLLWTSVIVYGLLLVEAIFHFWFVTVVATIVIGLATFVWIRWVHFPPQIEAYERQLHRARTLAQQRPTATRAADPSATIRSRKQRRRRS